MSVLQRRDRIVVFRLTQEENKHLMKACSRTGARNLSDYTRTQLLDRAATRTSSDRIETRLTKFDKRLTELQSSVRQMTRLLKQLSTP